MGIVLCGIVCILCGLLGIALIAIGLVYTRFCGDRLEENMSGYTFLVTGLLLVLAYVSILWIG